MRGGLTIAVDAEVSGVEVTSAACALLVPCELSAAQVIGALFPEAQVEAVLASKAVYEQDVVYDGRKLSMESYEGGGAALTVELLKGQVDYASAAKQAWEEEISAYYQNRPQENIRLENDGWSVDTSTDNYKMEERDWIDAFGTKEASQETLRQIARAMGITSELTLIDAHGMEESIGGKTCTYNQLDFAVNREGILCANRGYTTELSPVHRRIPGQYVTAALNENGLYTWVSRIYSETAHEEAAALLPYTAALDAMAKQYGGLGASGQMDIRAIALCYVMTPTKGSMLTYRLEPAWRLCTEARDWSASNMDFGNKYYYSALTGQPIV